MKSIALVDDNRDSRLLVRALLSDLYAVSDYETAYEAMQAFQGCLPDLIILDVSLPGMDGMELLAQLRTSYGLKDTPIIALTAHALIGDRERCLAAGFNDYVAKPIVNEDAFLRLVDRWVNRKH